MLKLNKRILSLMAILTFLSCPLLANDEINPCKVIDDARYPDERRYCERLHEENLKAPKDSTLLSDGSNLELSQCEFQNSNSTIVCADGSSYRRTDDVVQIGRSFSSSGLAKIEDDRIDTEEWNGKARLEINLR
ncbi:MAG: hypothetical protein NXH75_08680 [Halobacteriovoraceae bacterium]|nr:hypothetical protein [Halobacteriovoraceae bacterium]